MTHIHDNEVNNISERNFLYYIPNPQKRTKKLNNNFSPILHAKMTTGKGKVKFKNFLILLDSVCSSKIAI